MKASTTIAATAAFALVSLGLASTGASAYSISGGSYVGTATSDHSFTVGGFYTSTCPMADTSFVGTATGADASSFILAYGSNCNFFGLPVAVTQSGAWEVEVTAGPDGLGWYTGEIHIASGATTTVEAPLMGCTGTITGSQVFQHGVNGNIIRARNVTPTGVQLEVAINGIAYAASGCPFPSGADGSFNTNGSVDVPGVALG